ncbi:MAG: OmpA family protein [Elusimicrobia bacterium]|nr:OmpA family protein [Elusimicrobiota bacterium]
MKLSTSRALAALFVAAVAVAGCAPRKSVKDQSTADASNAPVQREGDSAMAPAAETAEVDIRTGDFTPIPDLAPVRFAYDAYSLSEDARAALKKNVEYIKAHPTTGLLVTGNCDERGTIEYNLALGQRRATAVREYYARLGIPAKTIGTISYGKEKPSCHESTEECWTKNRRAETLMRKSPGGGVRDAKSGAR